jgi:hypothetical protein
VAINGPIAIINTIIHGATTALFWSGVFKGKAIGAFIVSETGSKSF